MDQKTIDAETTIKIKKPDGWEETNDIFGHKPKFKMKCMRCNMNGRDSELELRHSVLSLTPDVEEAVWIKHHPDTKKPERTKEQEIFLKEHLADSGDIYDLNIMSYKCPTCAWFLRFHVAWDREYLVKILDKREGYRKLVPDWENEEVGKQLEAMGYWAGR
jgi:hypothetical protein